LVGIHPDSRHDLRRHVESPCPQRRAVGGERDIQHPLVVSAARATDPPLRLEALDERRQGGRFHRKLLRELTQRARRVLPEGEHHEVLRVRQAEGIEDRTIDGDDVACGRHESEAQLVLELQQIVARIHASTVLISLVH
jgi:hypothetical protein